MLRYKERRYSFSESDIDHKVTDIRLYSDDSERILLEFKPVRMPSKKGDLYWEDWNHYDSICIYKTDYDRLLLPAITSLFPVTDPDPKGFGIQESLDLTTINFFGKEDWQKLIDNLTGCMEKADETEAEFYRSVIGFLNDFMTVSDWYCIEGNL
ncbi:MAG: hypothetical protein IK020_03015 [Clostridiales bacterium]|nr:hypothetical protein [Clostridiales bacterium]MBR5974133.1 hypothetical protein [Clostridiales bacterium]